MIYKLNKSDCYNISGKLILNNKYSKVEGDQYNSYYVKKELYSGNEGTFSAHTIGGRATDTKEYRPNQGLVIYNYKFQYVFYYRKLEAGQLVSTELMDTNLTSFSTSLQGSNASKKTAQLGSGMPAITASFPSLSDLTIYNANTFFDKAVARLSDHALQWLGTCVVSYSDITSFTVTPTIWYISQIQIRFSYDTPGFGDGSDDDAAMVQLSGLTYTVNSTNFFQESASYSYGEDNSILTYKLPDNELFDIDSYFIESEENKPIITKVSERILNNYKKGKQVLNIECPTLDIEDTNGTIYAEHLFEPGQYFYILDEVGSSLFNYKLTNIPKVFEIISAEYVQEGWNLVLKEVAKVESN